MPGGQVRYAVAQFTISYYASAIDSFRALGTKGSIVMSPSFLYGALLEREMAIGQKKSHKAQVFFELHPQRPRSRTRR